VPIAKRNISTHPERPREQKECPSRTCTLGGVTTPVLGAVGWLVVGGLMLYAKSRGRTAAFEREHPALSAVAFAVVAWAAAGSLVLLVVVAAVVAGPVVPVVLWRGLGAAAFAALGFATGRHASVVTARRPLDGRTRVRSLVAVIAIGLALNWWLNGARGLLFLAALGCIYLAAFMVGSRSQRGPSPAPGRG
jgi:hypothetical protein